jgi:hypothetical protein
VLCIAGACCVAHPPEARPLAGDEEGLGLTTGDGVCVLQWRYRQQMADIEANTMRRRMAVLGKFWQAQKGWQWQDRAVLGVVTWCVIGTILWPPQVRPALWFQLLSCCVEHLTGHCVFFSAGSGTRGARDSGEIAQR